MPPGSCLPHLDVAVEPGERERSERSSFGSLPVAEPVNDFETLTTAIY